MSDDPPRASAADLDDRVRRWVENARRRVLGIAGPPGSGKSTHAERLAARFGPAVAHVPLDGFHLADVELARLGLTDRKGAPETFDPWGYAALLARLRSGPDHVVYAPGFERELEQPVAGAIPVAPEVVVVVAEGNYLLLDEPGWREVRAQLDEAWYLAADERVRRGLLVARHVAFGKPPAAAEAWVRRVDEANARLVEDTRRRADRVVEIPGS